MVKIKNNCSKKSKISIDNKEIIKTTHPVGVFPRTPSSNSFVSSLT